MEFPPGVSPPCTAICRSLSLLILASFPVWRPSVIAADASPYLSVTAGPLLIRPQFSISQGLSDNLFSNPDRIGDSVTVLGTGFELQVGKAFGNFAVFDYSVGQRLYAAHRDLDGTDHSLTLGINYRLAKLSFAASESVQFLNQPIGSVLEGRTEQPSSGGATDEPGPPSVPSAPPSVGETFVRLPAASIRRMAHSGNYSLAYALSDKTRLYLQASHELLAYQARIDLLDHQTMRGVLGYNYQAFPRTSLFGEFSVGRTTSEPNAQVADQPSSIFFGGSLGVRGRFTERISGELKLGYEARTFGDLLATPDYPVFGATVSYQASPKRNFALSLGRAQDISSQYAESSYSHSTVNLRVNQSIGSARKWSASAGGTFSRYDYSGAGGSSQNYDRYEAALSLRYQIQLWLAANMSYSFGAIRRHSSKADNYSANQINLSFEVGY